MILECWVVLGEEREKSVRFDSGAERGDVCEPQGTENCCGGCSNWTKPPPIRSIGTGEVRARAAAALSLSFSHCRFCHPAVPGKGMAVPGCRGASIC